MKLAYCFALDGYFLSVPSYSYVSYVLMLIFSDMRTVFWPRNVVPRRDNGGV